MAQFTVLERDAENERLVIKRVDEAGADVAGKAKVTISLADAQTLLDAAGATDLELKFRWLQFKDSDNACRVTKILYLGSAPIVVG